MAAEKHPENALRAEGLTRQQVADLLEVSVSSIRRLEGTRLHPAQDQHGVWRFAREEVERLNNSGSVRLRAPRRARGRSEGAAAARVFQMFAEGRSLREIVSAARQTPERVRELYQHWLVGLREGEQQRRARERQERASREHREAQRAHLDMMKLLRSREST